MKGKVVGKMRTGVDLYYLVDVGSSRVRVKGPKDLEMGEEWGPEA